MTRLVDLTGQRFGALVVLRRAPNRGRKSAWWVRCDCGAEKVTRGGGLKGGSVKSCGPSCRFSPSTTGRITHGKSKTVEYRIWKNMISRCETPSQSVYPHYGGRGIKVCDRWRNSFEVFLADMGPRPSPRHSIDRIDVDGDYEPNNCRWADAAEQRANRRDPLKLDAVSACLIRHMRRRGAKLRELARAFGVSEQSVSRVVRGKAWADALDRIASLKMAEAQAAEEAKEVIHG